MLGCKWPCIAGPIAFLRRLFKRVLVVGTLRTVHRHLQLIHMLRVGVEPGVQPFALEVDDGAIVAHLGHFRHWVIGHGGGTSGHRQDSGMAGEGPGQPAGQGRPGSVIRGDGVGLVEATGGGGNPFRKIPAPVVAQGLQAPALKIEVERVAA